MKRIAVILVVLLAAGAYGALPDIVAEVSADGVVALAPGSSTGATGFADMKAIGGAATVYFTKWNTATSSQIRWPASGTIALDADDPRHFEFGADSPDTAHFVLSTASKVDVLVVH